MKLQSTLAAVLLAACATASAQVQPLPMALCAGWEGERVCELLQEDTQIRVLRCTFPPGVGHEMHYHPPHFGYVLEGDSVMRITTADGVVDRPVHAGSSFSNDSEIQHAALNVGDQTTRYLIIEKKYADTRPPEAVAPGLCAR
ncbi:MAG: cupin domain-containing protein [Hyphomonadaceae bacterium]|nr:cupin domain-containing protein [Hyphomonadaceae bacterium]